MQQKLPTNTYAIVFNGPAYSGKDVGAKGLMKNFSKTLDADTYFDRFSMPLKKAVAGWVGYEVNQYGDCELEDYKDEPRLELLGQTYRRAQIEYWQWLSSRHGDDVLGRLLVQRIAKQVDAQVTVPQIILIPDAGRGPEVQALKDVLPDNHLLIVQLRRDGTSFKKDIRCYVEIPDTRIIEVTNNYTETMPYIEELRHHTLNWLQETASV